MILDLFRKEIGFENIQGYDDIKDIVKRALDAEDNYNLLFIVTLSAYWLINLAEKIYNQGYRLLQQKIMQWYGGNFLNA
jgi:hypothetical protein